MILRRRSDLLGRHIVRPENEGNKCCGLQTFNILGYFCRILQKTKVYDISLTSYFVRQHRILYFFQLSYYFVTIQLRSEANLECFFLGVKPSLLIQGRMI
jgi:hypothetical protein